MGRKPSRNKNLPKGMRARHRGDKTYFYLDTGALPRVEIPLGTDYVVAVQKWAQMTMAQIPASGVVTLQYAWQRYLRDVVPTKAPSTQKDNLREAAKLLEFFEGAPLDSIEPMYIRQYLDWRDAKVRANREKALFSHIWNYARGKGLTSMPNPCAGIKGNKEVGRDTYVTDDVYKAVYTCAEQHLQDAMDLAYLIGQRPADTLKARKADIVDGALNVVQNKTGKRIRLAITGDLEKLMQRITARKVSSMFIICTAAGQPVSRFMLRGAFDRARKLAIEKHPKLASEIKNFQFRDLRAKAGTDKEEREGMKAAQDQLGHTTETMTSHYVRHRRGKLVSPTK